MKGNTSSSTTTIANTKFDRAHRRRIVSSTLSIATLLCTLTGTSNAFLTPPSSHNEITLATAGVAQQRRQPITHTSFNQQHPRQLLSSTTRLSAVVGNLDELIMSAQSSAANLANLSFSTSTGPTPLSLLALYGAGLLTSFSPCTFGMLPLTISYISAAAGERSDKTAFLPTVAFAAGLASVFCGLGLSVSYLGGVFGQTSSESVIGSILLALVSSGVCITMGLQLLNLIKVPLPSLALEPPPLNGADAIAEDKNKDATVLLRTFLLGGSSALVASPCSTPVLTSILAFVAASRDTSVGVALLFTYTVGYVTPLLLISATGGQALAKVQALAFSRGDESWVSKVGGAVQPVSAAVLIWYGTDHLLTGIFGDASLAGLPIVQ
eukprot:CAMPEP_0172499962 /NCGR_PEP_ID=MMETSP1066-20121228/132953_1 /TAXON_ID=671091 /ORGANISM="Coscinodiscus wailesii, Strain CCMP2513" /LENGTH=380 /DNA_ID=CAMNT_0013273979 /DNA_START=233 /DNA_END=1375 /DNA_ORIENTATION=-